MAALDIKEHQILVRFDEDPEVTWHHMVLLQRTKGTTWLALTPDLAVQRLDLSEREVLPFTRGRVIPSAQAGDCYIFDAVGPKELAEAHATARQLAELHGADGAEESATTWVIADPMHAKFGEAVEASLLGDPTRSTLRSRLGVVEIVGGDPESEVVVEQVATVTTRGEGSSGSWSSSPYPSSFGLRRCSDAGRAVAWRALADASASGLCWPRRPFAVTPSGARCAALTSRPFRGGCGRLERVEQGQGAERQRGVLRGAFGVSLEDPTAGPRRSREARCGVRQPARGSHSGHGAGSHRQVEGLVQSGAGQRSALRYGLDLCREGPPAA